MKIIQALNNDETLENTELIVKMTQEEFEHISYLLENEMRKSPIKIAKPILDEKLKEYFLRKEHD